jgi:ABC-type glycerol-3-phosphate transport system permease component
MNEKERYTGAWATPDLIGRRAILEQIDTALSDASGPSIIALYGPGGIGKTRILNDTLKRSRPGDRLAQQAVDLYDMRYHGSLALAGAIYASLEVADGSPFRTFEKEREQQSRAQTSGDVRQIAKATQNALKAFIADLNRFSQSQHVVLALDVVFILPFLWMVSTSLKQSEDVFPYPPSFFPTTFLWQNYPRGWTILPFNTFLINLPIVTSANVIGNLISCSPAVFGFARLRARGRGILFLTLLATLMIPREVTIVPRFLLFSQMGLVNTLCPLILPAWFGYAFFIFLLRQFFMTIPTELDDAARIDGTSLATVAIFAFIGNWSNLLDPLISIRSQGLYTLALGLNLFRGQNFPQFNLLMAVSIITLIPVLTVFFLSQRLFVQCVTLTGMEGDRALREGRVPGRNGRFSVFSSAFAPHPPPRPPSPTRGEGGVGAC